MLLIKFPLFLGLRCSKNSFHKRIVVWILLGLDLLRNSPLGLAIGIGGIVVVATTHGSDKLLMISTFDVRSDQREVVFLLVRCSSPESLRLQFQ